MFWHSNEWMFVAWWCACSLDVAVLYKCYTETYVRMHDACSLEHGYPDPAQLHKRCTINCHDGVEVPCERIAHMWRTHAPSWVSITSFDPKQNWILRDPSHHGSFTVTWYRAGQIHCWSRPTNRHIIMSRSWRQDWFKRNKWVPSRRVISTRALPTNIAGYRLILDHVHTKSSNTI